MKKAILLLCMAWATIVYGQKQVDTLWRNEINRVFKGIDKSRVPHRVLLDYALESTNVPAYNGTLTDSTAVNVHVFSDIYSTLYMGQTVRDTVTFPSLKKVAQTWVDERIKANSAAKNTLVLAGLYYKYSRISADAHEKGAIKVVDNTFYEDVFENSIWQNPYETLHTLAFAAPVLSYNKKNFNLLLPQGMMLGNSLSDIAQVEVDAGDGKGYRTLNFGSPLSLTYTDNGTYKIIFRLTLIDHSVLLSHIHLLIHESSGDNVTEVTDISGAKLTIEYAPLHNGHLVKPLIIVEGFDSGSITDPEKEGGDTTIITFKNSIPVGGQLHGLLVEDGTQIYDLIYIDWNNGTADLLDNAVVLENVINWVNQASGNKEIVLLGQSMGGVISRYTLASMEEADKTHNVRLFISHDAPMQGSNSLLSAMQMSRHLYNQYIDMPISSIAESDVLMSVFIGLGEYMADALNWSFNTNLSTSEFVSPGDVLTIQDTPAAVEMNYYWVDFQQGTTSAYHEYWQSLLDEAGYPEQCRKVAISNGNECGNDQGFAPRDVLASMHGEGSKSFWRRFLWGLATPLVGIATDDIELALLGLVPGTSRYYFDFDLRALPEEGAQDKRIYDGKVRYKKEFLWITEINIWHTMTMASGDAPDDAIPYDTYSGGSIDISSVAEDLPAFFPEVDFPHPRYGFIPTISALDVKRNDSNPDVSDYLKVYAGNEMPDSALSTPFNNFIVEARTEALYNNPHISFQMRTGDWLVNELAETTNNVADCSFICEAGTISGPEIACNAATVTYTVSEGFDEIEWGIVTEGAANITSGQGTNQVTVKFTNGFNGNFTIYAYLESYDCGIVYAYGQTWVGVPSTPILSGISNAASASLVNYLATSNGATSYQWTLPGNYQVVTDFNLSGANWQIKEDNVNDASISPYTGTGGYGGTVTVKACNQCGCSAVKSMNVTISSHGVGITLTPDTSTNGGTYRIAPNPADTYTNVYLFDENKAPASTAVIAATLYDFYGVYKTAVNIRDNQAYIDVSSYPEGIYILTIVIDGTAESHLLSVDR